jgi:methylenetetrahydrofolate reductase (NADPH)
MVTPVESTLSKKSQKPKKATISIELFPPKDSDGEAKLWAAVETLKELHPDFVSVTYGAGGSTRDRTIRIAEEFTSRTGVSTVAHLTCVGSTKSELIEILRHYKSAGINSVLALRGDPTGGPSAPWVTTPGGFDHADQLVELAIEEGGFEVGVAAFPDGHPASLGDFNRDIDTLIRKEELGATFATTQFFFEFSAYQRLVDSLAAKGSKLPIIAGILPITNVKQLQRMAELSGIPIPSTISDKFTSLVDDPDGVRELGIELATNLSQSLLDFGAPGLHFYTMNTATATMAIARNLGLNNREER